MVRVLAGALKGKVFRYPKYRIRPTTESTRAAIFNMIGDSIIQARVADFFCGAGALGIEALSRGARSVWFFEKSIPAIKFLRKNLEGLNNVKIIRCDVLKQINKIKGIEFDIILADPPYLKGLVNPFLARIVQAKILSKQGLVILQHHKKEEIELPETYYFHQQKRYGDTMISIIKEVK